MVGSSANPGLRDFAVVAAIVHGRQAHPGVSFDINPTSRQILQDLTKMGGTFDLIAAGARLHQSGCMGCIGMGQAPAVGGNSLRTFPRNFPGRSGTMEDSVYLCSPETAAAAALTGRITDPRELPGLLGIDYPRIELPGRSSVNTAMLEPPLPAAQAGQVELVKGPNISSLPDFGPLPDRIEAPVALKVGDDVSTDEILPAGARVLPYRSNIPRLAEFTFGQLDDSYPQRVMASRDGSGHLVVAGSNYGQGSSREHAVIAPRYLGLRAVLAVSFARIHWQNLANFGVLALEFTDPDDYQSIEQGDVLILEDLRNTLRLRFHGHPDSQLHPRPGLHHRTPVVGPAGRHGPRRRAAARDTRALGSRRRGMSLVISRRRRPGRPAHHSRRGPVSRPTCPVHALSARHHRECV